MAVGPVAAAPAAEGVGVVVADAGAALLDAAVDVECELQAARQSAAAPASAAPLALSRLTASAYEGARRLARRAANGDAELAA